MRRLHMRCKGLNDRTWRIFVVALLVAVVVGGCAAEQRAPEAVVTKEIPVAADTQDESADSGSGITVTFDGDKCFYHGPGSVSAGRIPVILDVRDQTDHELYSLGVATLDEGKTFEDLAANPFTSGVPLWLHEHGGVEAARGALQQTTVVVFEGPLFLVCFTAHPDQKTDVLGPIEVHPVATRVPPTQPLVQASPTGTPAPAEEWDLLVIGDSTMWGVAPLYAAHIEQDLGVKVTSHTWIRGGLSSSFLLDALGWSEELRGLVQEAEVVAFIANPTEHIGWFIVTGGGDHDCSEEAVAGYADDYRTIIESFQELRKGQPTVIRGAEFYNPIYSVWKKQGTYDELQPCWEALNDAIVEVCTQHNVLVADVYSAFNGLDHHEDPRDKGYIGGDGEHTSKLGQQVIAQVLRELGYEYTVP